MTRAPYFIWFDRHFTFVVLIVICEGKAFSGSLAATAIQCYCWPTGFFIRALTPDSQHNMQEGTFDRQIPYPPAATPQARGKKMALHDVTSLDVNFTSCLAIPPFWRAKFQLAKLCVHSLISPNDILGYPPSLPPAYRYRPSLPSLPVLSFSSSSFTSQFIW